MKGLSIIAGFLFSLVFLWLALRDTSWEDIYASFAAANIWFVVPLLGCLCVYYLMRAARWRRILDRSHKASTGQLIPALMIGAAGNNLLPAHLGEVVRIYYTGEKLQIAKSTVLATLVVERVFDLIAVLAIFAVALLLVTVSFKLKILALLVMLATLALYIACWLMGRYSDSFVSMVGKCAARFSTSFSEGVVYHAEHLAQGMKSLQSGKDRNYVLLNSLMQWLCMAACIYCAILAFGLETGFAAAVVVLGITVMGLLLPTSPGFFGTIEYAFVLGLGAIGIDASTAFSVAIFYHIPAWITVCCTGVALFMSSNMSLRDIVKARKSRAGS